MDFHCNSQDKQIYSSKRNRKLHLVLMRKEFAGWMIVWCRSIWCDGACTFHFIKRHIHTHTAHLYKIETAFNVNSFVIRRMSKNNQTGRQKHNHIHWQWITALPEHKAHSLIVQNRTMHRAKVINWDKQCLWTHTNRMLTDCSWIECENATA